MPALHSITAYEPDPDCTKHDLDGLVCETHPDQPWQNDTPGGDHCGAPGMPCSCNRWACGSVGASCACTA